MPPLYQFRYSDSIESRSGKWYVQVQRATSDTHTTKGTVHVDLFCTETENPGLRWRKRDRYVLSQEDFVNLLRTGKCSLFSLVED